MPVLSDLPSDTLDLFLADLICLLPCQGIKKNIELNLLNFTIIFCKKHPYSPGGCEFYGFNEGCGGITLC